jgi:hypothetical protein
MEHMPHLKMKKKKERWEELIKERNAAMDGDGEILAWVLDRSLMACLSEERRDPARGGNAPRVWCRVWGGVWYVREGQGLGQGVARMHVRRRKQMPILLGGRGWWEPRAHVPWGASWGRRPPQALDPPAGRWKDTSMVLHAVPSSQRVVPSMQQHHGRPLANQAARPHHA